MNMTLSNTQAWVRNSTPTLNADHLTSHLLIWYQKFPIHGWLNSKLFEFGISVAFFIVSRDVDCTIGSSNDINTSSFRRTIPGDATDWHTVDIIFVYPTEYLRLYGRYWDDKMKPSAVNFMESYKRCHRSLLKWMTIMDCMHIKCYFLRNWTLISHTHTHTVSGRVYSRYLFEFVR